VKANIEFFKTKLAETHIEFTEVTEFTATWEQTGDLFKAGGFLVGLTNKRWAYIHYNESEVDWTTYNKKLRLKEIEKEYNLEALKIKWQQNPAELNSALGIKPKKPKPQKKAHYTYHAVWKFHESEPFALFKDEKIAREFAKKNIINPFWKVEPFIFREMS